MKCMNSMVPFGYLLGVVDASSSANNSSTKAVNFVNGILIVRLTSLRSQGKELETLSYPFLLLFYALPSTICR